MKYRHRPKFWLILIANQIAAFVLSAALATGVALIFVLVGMHQHQMAIVTKIAGPIINLYLSYSAFFYVRNRARRWPQPQPPGFPFIWEAGEINAGEGRLKG